MIFIAGIMLVLGQGMVTAYSPSYYSSKTTDTTTGTGTTKYPTKYTTTKYPYWSTTSDIWPGEADISGSVGPQRVKLCSGYQHEHDCDNQTVIFHVDQWREDSNENRFSPFGEKIALPVPCKFKFWPHCQNPKSTTWPKTTTTTTTTTTRNGYTTKTTTKPWPPQIDTDRDSTGKPSRRTGSTTRGHKTTTSRGHVTTTRNLKMDCWKMTCQYAITHLDDLEVKAHATIYKPSGHWPVGKTQDLQDGRMKILATTKYFGGSLDAHVRKDTEPNGFRISGNFKLHSKPMLAADEP